MRLMSAVPRDVDPAMNKLEGIFVYDIDDLQTVAASLMAERAREASSAVTLIAAEVGQPRVDAHAGARAPAVHDHKDEPRSRTPLRPRH